MAKPVVSPKKLVVKSNAYVMSHYSLSKNAQKILNMAISKIPKQPTDIEKQIQIEMTATEIKRFLETESGTIYETLDDAAKELTNVLIEIEGIDENGKAEKELVRPFPYARYNEGEIVIRFEQFMNKHLLNLSSNFVRYELTSIKGLRSKFSIRMFEILSCIEYKKHEYYTLEEFKELIGCVKISKIGEGKHEEVVRQDAYARFNDFKVRVLDTAKKELDALSRLSFTYETETKGRKVIGLHINVYENTPSAVAEKTKNEVVIDSTATEVVAISTMELMDLIDECRTFLPAELKSSDITKLLEKAEYKVPVIREKYDIAKEQKEINNLVAWMLTAIEKDYSPQVVKMKKTSKANFDERQYDRATLERELLHRNA